MYNLSLELYKVSARIPRAVQCVNFISTHIVRRSYYRMRISTALILLNRVYRS